MLCFWRKKIWSTEVRNSFSFDIFSIFQPRTQENQDLPSSTKGSYLVSLVKHTLFHTDERERETGRNMEGWRREKTSCIYGFILGRVNRGQNTKVHGQCVKVCGQRTKVCVKGIKPWGHRIKVCGLVEFLNWDFWTSWAWLGPAYLYFKSKVNWNMSKTTNFRLFF